MITHQAFNEKLAVVRDLALVLSWDSVLQYFGLYVHQRRSSGTLYLGCVFHNERSPSLALWPKSKMFLCHGCGRGGDIADFVDLYCFGKNIEGLSLYIPSDVDAITELHKKLQEIAKI